ncbi:MAG TPA: glycosyltransferase family 4 protein [Methylomirabilota bacterium]|nr:glycosyltransferase family 4 protein [Methylomirabilota bacterium]
MTPAASASFRSARPLRIIQVFNRYLMPGGEEKSVARIAADLAAAGHTVSRFWRESAEWKGPQAPPRWRQPLLLWRNDAVLDELRRLHESTGARLWLLHNVIPVVSLGIYRLARELGVPIVQWLHNYRPFSPSGTLTAGARALAPDDPWIALRESLAGSWNGRALTAWLSGCYWLVRRRGDFESVRAWVAVSEEMRQIFRQAGWYPDRLHAIPHSWHLRGPMPESADEGHFLFLGRMVETKGVRFLVRLWERPELRQATLVMAGQGPLADELRTKTPPNVRWVGHVEGEMKLKLLAGCRAILFPCLWAEPLSTVAYEGYEQARPILASNLGGMKEVVLDRVTGRLLPPGDEAAWIEALLQLDAATAREWGQRGRRWLEETVSPAVWNRRFDEVVRHL